MSLSFLSNNIISLSFSSVNKKFFQVKNFYFYLKIFIKKELTFNKKNDIMFLLKEFYRKEVA